MFILEFQVLITSVYLEFQIIFELGLHDLVKTNLIITGNIHIT